MTCVECVYCRGRGCGECGGTGERYTHLIEVEGASAIVHGNAPLTDESRDALEALLRAAYEKMHPPAASGG